MPADPSKARRIMLEVIVKVLKWLEMEIDFNEVECIMSILIDKNQVKGYFAHRSKVSVLAWYSFIHTRIFKTVFRLLLKGIAPVAIIDRQLPFEYTITSRSTDMVGMALLVQNINHSAFKLMFEREKISGTNFNDWFRQLKLVLRVEKKMFVIEQPIPSAPAVDSEANVLVEWNAIYDAHNEVACLMLRSMTLELHRQFENYSPYEMLHELKSMFEKQARVESVGLILNGLASYFARFVRNYNMHNMGKIIGEIHALLIEYEKGLPKKAKTPLEVVKSRKPIRNRLKLKARRSKKAKTRSSLLYMGNGVRAQVEAIGSYDLVLPNGLVICLENCHYAPSITRGVVSVHRLLENGFVQCFTNFGISVSKNNIVYFNVIPSNGIYEIDMHNLVPNVNSIYNVSTKRAKHNLDSTYLWHCRLAHISKKRKMTRKLFPHHLERATDFLGIIHTDVCGPLRHVSRQGASYFITFTDDYSRYGYVYLLKHKHEVFETFKVFKNKVENQLGKIIKALQSDRGGGRYHTLLDMVRSMMNLTTLPLSFCDYALESATRILNMVPTKKVDKTPYKLWYGKVLNLSYLKVWGYESFVKQKSLITQEVSGGAIDFEEIQNEDTTPSEITSKIPMEVEGFEPPQEEAIPISTMLNPESNIWLDAMNAKMQSMMDSMVWVLVDLPPNCKTVGSKWIFKKKTDMDGIVHTYKARLVAKGYTQLYGVDYEETFSPVADIRAIRILISIAAFYDYEIWQMDVKTAFLNGYLDEDIYMVQPEGFVDPKHPRKVCKLQRSIYGLKQASRS
ncbi:retrotransposon protein, putative, ty1-copia subclass [Tanacetum coccineum]